MTPRTLYAFLVGALVGGGPFGLILLPGATVYWSRLVGPVLAFALTATAYRSPGSWAAGAVAGVVGGWVAFSLLIGGGFDWRLIVYLGVMFEYYYLAVAAGGSLALAEWSRSRKRSA